MIGTRAVLYAGVAVAGVALVVGPSTDDPGVELAARGMVVVRAERALDALDTLEGAIAPGFQAARRGAGRIVGGADPPGSELRRAGEQVAAAEGAATDARTALTELNRALGAWHPSAQRLSMPMEGGELASIGAQLEASAEAADDFAAMRGRAAALLAEVDAGLAAMSEGQLGEAVSRAAGAREHHAALAAWEVDLATLPIWLEATDEMIGAMELMVQATRSGDAEEVNAAAARFGALADEAASTDRALRIAVDEGGSAVTAAPLSRLAAVLSGVADTRISVEAAREASDR